MDWLLEKMLLYPKRAIAISIVVLVLIGAALWTYFVWENPQHVFEDMMAANLATTSVTKTVAAGSDSQSLEQSIRLQMGGTNAAEWVVTVKQSGASISTDSIGTASAGYIRYTRISTSQRKPDNSSYNFSAVLNVWGKGDGKTDTSLNGLYEQTLLDISSAPAIPIGNLPDAQRENILTFIRGEKVFTPDYTKVKADTVDGRPVYTYAVAVKLAPYVRMMQAFAHDLGLKSLDATDPAQYANLQPVTMTISVDRVSHELVQLSYPSTGFVQTYGDWGLLLPIMPPAHTVTTTELQQRLQRIGS